MGGAVGGGRGGLGAGGGGGLRPGPRLPFSIGPQRGGGYQPGWGRARGGGGGLRGGAAKKTPGLLGKLRKVFFGQEKKSVFFSGGRPISGGRGGGAVEKNGKGGKGGVPWGARTFSFFQGGEIRKNRGGSLGGPGGGWEKWKGAGP